MARIANFLNTVEVLIQLVAEASVAIERNNKATKGYGSLTGSFIRGELCLSGLGKCKRKIIKWSEGHQKGSEKTVPVNMAAESDMSCEVKLQLRSWRK